MNVHSSDSHTTLPADLAGAHELIEQLRGDLHSERARRIATQYRERCFRELAEHIREVFWMTNPLGDELIYISPAYEQIWGQSCASLYEDPGRRLAWVHEADRQKVLVAFMRDTPHGRFDETYRIDRPDGEIRWIHDRAVPIYDEHGDIYRIAGYALDITEQMHDSDRIDEIQTDIQSRDRMSVFAALGTGLAHAVSQPLTASRNYIANVLRGTPDHRAADTLKQADREIEHAMAVIRHLRDFAREGKPSVVMQPLAPLLEEVRLTLDPALRARGIRYHGPDLGAIAELELPLDAVFAQQVVRNLLNNAIDAFDNGHDGPREVWVDVNTDDENYIEIAVSDNGVGVHNGIDLFEPFVTTKDHALGLDLAVCRTLAKSHGGDLRLANRGDCAAGEPTRFVLRLPRALDDAQPAKPRAPEPAGLG